MIKSIYLNSNFFVALAAIVFIYVLSYVWPILLPLAHLCLALFIIFCIADSWRLSQLTESVFVTRDVPLKLSLSDGETIYYTLENQSQTKLHAEFFDELPEQFQHRGMIRQLILEAEEIKEIPYFIRPYERGEYQFGKCYLIYSLAPFHFIQRRLTFDLESTSMVIPSVKQMRKHELQVFSQTASLSGIRKIRQVGENDEFEHIRPYAQGDNIKSINWKATSRQNQLMVNQYQNSRHQSVYCILDKGRSMKMPFDGMTLLDYSINSVLSISNIILKKFDYAGLITFSDTIDSMVKASAKQGQLERIAGHLYKQSTGFKESNFELLHQLTRRLIKNRSIWLFYTNFETPHDLRRQLPYMKLMSRRHLFVVIIFINTELEAASDMEVESKSDIYTKTFAEKMIMEKELIKDELIRNGIQTILTKPSELSINVINKYLEIKARRLR